MKDSVSIQRVALLHPKVQADFQAFIEDSENDLNIILRVVQGLRTFAEQQEIYNEGRTTLGKIVTKAKAGQSYHNYGLAIDVVPVIKNGKALDWEYDFTKLVPFAAKYGITWGGHFPSPDRDHFEKKMSHNWRDLLALYQANKFIPGTKYVDI